MTRPRTGTPRQRAPQHHWTGDEDDRLCRHYPGLGPQKTQEQYFPYLRRDQVRSRAVLLGLVMTPAAIAARYARLAREQRRRPPPLPTPAEIAAQTAAIRAAHADTVEDFQPDWVALSAPVV